MVSLYSPNQRILCVGEGNFSFSCALLRLWEQQGESIPDTTPQNYFFFTQTGDPRAGYLVSTSYETGERIKASFCPILPQNKNYLAGAV